MTENERNMLPTVEQVEKFVMLYGFMLSIYKEMKEFSKKSLDGVLNQLKVKTINKVLEQIKILLASEPTVEFLGKLDDETLPTYSDAVLTIGQFVAAMDDFKEKFWSEDEERWLTQENPP